MTISGNTLEVNGKRVTFIHKIKTVLTSKGQYLVLLHFYKNINSGHELWNNVYGVNEDLDIIWQISGSKPRAYVDIFYYDEEFHAVDWEGMSCVPNIATGKIIREDFVK